MIASGNNNNNEPLTASNMGGGLCFVWLRRHRPLLDKQEKISPHVLLSANKSPRGRSAFWLQRQRPSAVLYSYNQLV